MLARALVPEIFDSFLTRLEHSDDPESVELTKRGWAARSWDPDEPRIEELASTLADELLTNRALLAMPTGFQNQPDAASRYGVNHHGEDQSPSIARLNTLVEANLRAAGMAVPHRDGRPADPALRRDGRLILPRPNGHLSGGRPRVTIDLHGRHR
ncbi:hypothetical protein [Streptomyces sp. NBC_00239]|uniref:hypothetical protein n=1 Tax=Streptomyces sp. NBC_00239 TaxID=2903640 RepID=UPI002E2A4DE5|nr:hypothetical protein [Streptomyces sp. NBC_00239]